MKSSHPRLLATVLFTAVFAGLCSAARAEPPAPVATATYECIGLVWAVPENGECRVRFRAAGSETWKDALGLCYDARDSEYRGSIVGLAAGSAYVVKLKTGDREAEVAVSTRSDRFPVGEVTEAPPGESRATVVIKDSGTPEAYHLFAPRPNVRSTIDVFGTAPFNIVIDADYVIVRGIELRNAGVHGIYIKPGRHDIVIDNCHIFGWGRIGGSLSHGGAEGDLDSAVFADKGCHRLTIQRNLIERPRGASNDWESGHPYGPQGISVLQSAGGNVLRYNEIISTEDHGFNDGIGGGSNFSTVGNMNRDSDIHGNFIRNCMDDAIECEGANANVRIWGNYLDYFYNGIATACVSRGPLYVYRNVWHRSRRTHRDSSGGVAVKVGERKEFGGGRRYIFHNTALQPGGVHDAFSAHHNPNCISRNNIFDCRGRLATRSEKPTSSSFDYDFYNGADKGEAVEKHGVGGKTAFLFSTRVEFFPAPLASVVRYGLVPRFPDDERHVTDPIVSVPNPVIDAGEALPGFNDAYVGKAPDLGAFEVGCPPLEYGRRAYLRWDEGWAPWERYP